MTTLGFIDDDNDETYTATPSDTFVGGSPALPRAPLTLRAAALRCTECEQPLAFVLQAYNDFTLYIYACTRPACCVWRAFRVSAAAVHDADADADTEGEADAGERRAATAAAFTFANDDDWGAADDDWAPAPAASTSSTSSTSAAKCHAAAASAEEASAPLDVRELGEQPFARLFVAVDYEPETDAALAHIDVDAVMLGLEEEERASAGDASNANMPSTCFYEPTDVFNKFLERIARAPGLCVFLCLFFSIFFFLVFLFIFLFVSLIYICVKIRTNITSWRQRVVARCCQSAKDNSSM